MLHNYIALFFVIFFVKVVTIVRFITGPSFQTIINTMLEMMIWSLLPSTQEKTLQIGGGARLLLTQIFFPSCSLVNAFNSGLQIR